LKANDSNAAPKVAVVNQAFVRKFLPGEFPIGQRLSHHGDIWEIVGVCRDIKYERVQEETPPTGYFSFRQKPAREAYFIMRTSLAPQAIAAAARKAVASIDRNVPVTDFATQGEIRAQTFKTQRTFATLCGSLAILALFLSCIGLYGLMAYDVTRRTTEIGIRQALGATRRQIAAPIVRRAVALAGFGVALGMPLTVVLTRLIQAALYGLKPSDPITLCGAVFLLLAVALIASWLPAHRAARVDPMVALRTE
jgi:predicted lysophospholipase L1 biosynthesis ABC-type transport system permease subunit